MRVSFSQQKKLAEEIVNNLLPMSKDETEVFADQVEVFRKRYLEEQKQEEMDTSKFSENGPINAGVDSIHSFLQYKRILDDTDFSKDFLDNTRKSLKEDVRRVLSLVA